MSPHYAPTIRERSVERLGLGAYDSLFRWPRSHLDVFGPAERAFIRGYLGLEAGDYPAAASFFGSAADFGLTDPAAIMSGAAVPFQAASEKDWTHAWLVAQEAEEVFPHAATAIVATMILFQRARTAADADPRRDWYGQLLARSEDARRKVGRPGRLPERFGGPRCRRAVLRRGGHRGPPDRGRRAGAATPRRRHGVRRGTPPESGNTRRHRRSRRRRVRGGGPLSIANLPTPRPHAEVVRRHDRRGRLTPPHHFPLPAPQFRDSPGNPVTAGQSVTKPKCGNLDAVRPRACEVRDTGVNSPTGEGLPGTYGRDRVGHTSGRLRACTRRNWYTRNWPRRCTGDRPEALRPGRGRWDGQALIAPPPRCPRGLAEGGGGGCRITTSPPVMPVGHSPSCVFSPGRVALESGLDVEPQVRVGLIPGGNRRDVVAGATRCIFGDRTTGDGRWYEKGLEFERPADVMAR